MLANTAILQWIILRIRLPLVLSLISRIYFCGEWRIFWWQSIIQSINKEMVKYANCNEVNCLLGVCLELSVNWLNGVSCPVKIFLLLYWLSLVLFYVVNKQCCTQTIKLFHKTNNFQHNPVVHVRQVVCFSTKLRPITNETFKHFLINWNDQPSGSEKSRKILVLAFLAYSDLTGLSQQQGRFPRMSFDNVFLRTFECWLFTKHIIVVFLRLIIHIQLAQCDPNAADFAWFLINNSHSSSAEKAWSIST